MVNQTKTKAKAYEVSDPKLVSYLFCCHFKLVGSPHLIGPQVFFPFEHTPEVEAEVENFNLKKTNPKIGLSQYGTKLQQVEKCPEPGCDGFLVVRNKYGRKFLGCSNYAKKKCRYTKAL